MQSAKDSFFAGLRDRLAALDPARTVFLDGELRPAVVVAENSAVTAAAPLPEVFYISFGGAQVIVPGARRPLLRLEARIAYRTRGSDDKQGVDRGRALAALDLELAQLLSPRFTAKTDYAQTPPAALGSAVLWSAPEFQPVESVDGELRRAASVFLFFWPEVDLP